MTDRRNERREAFSRIIKAVYDGYAADPIPPEWLDALDRPRKRA